MTYELMLVIDPKAGVDSAVSLVEKTLKEAKAESVKVSKMGRKNLAYPIGKNSDAEYVVVNFAAEGETPKMLSDKLKVEKETIIRFLVMRVKEVKIKKKAVSGEQEKKVEVTPKVTVKTVSKAKKSERVKESKVVKAGKKVEKKVKSVIIGKRPVTRDKKGSKKK